VSAPGRNGDGVRRVMYYMGYPQRMAGGNRSMFELVVNLPPRVRPLVVVAGEGRVVDAFRAAGVEVEVVVPPGGLNRFGRAVLAQSAAGRARMAVAEAAPFVLRLRRMIAERGIDLVHVNDVRGAALAAPAARMAGRPVVAHLRGELPFGRLGRFLFERSGHRIVTVSEGVRATLSPAGRRRAVTVYNGIRELPPSPRKLPWLESLRARGVAVVACFASVVPFKGHHHLVRAAALLNERGWRDRVAFVCVGDLVAEHGPYREWVMGTMRELGVDNVTFTGWQDDPFAFYPYADLTVLPSVTYERIDLGGGETIEARGNEGFPRTHLEAMRFGLPIVGTRIAGVPEQVLDGVTGRVVEPGDPAALADAIEELLRDPARRREMGERGRERVERLFSTRAYVEGVLAVYDAL